MTNDIIDDAAIACTALCPHGLDIAARYENAKRDLAAARALLRDCLPELDGDGTTIHRVWAALSEGKK